MEKEPNSTIILVDYWDLLELDGRGSCQNLKKVATRIAQVLDLMVESERLK